MRYARVDENNIVVEIFNCPEGTSINDCFVPILASQFIEVLPEVDYNWVKQEDGTFISPTPVVEEVTTLPEEIVTPTEEAVVNG